MEKDETYSEKKQDFELEEEPLPEEMEFNLSDFALFLAVMKNEEAQRCVLSIIMGEPDLELVRSHVEDVVLNRRGKRAIRLDALAEDTRRCRYVTEMQNDTDHDDVKKRSRYYQGLLDVPVLKAGRETRYRQLPSTVVTFITQEDIFDRDRAKYIFTEQCEGVDGLHLEDGTTKLFLNMSSRNGDPALVSLLQYMKKTRIDNPEIPVIDDRLRTLDRIVQEVKQSEEWEDVKMSILSIGMERGMARGMEQGMVQGMARGIEVGEMRRLISMVCRKLVRGKDAECIAEELEEPVESIQAICRAAKDFAPEYDVEKIYKAMRHTQPNSRL